MYLPINQARVKSPTLPSVCGLWESHQFDGNVGRLEVVTDICQVDYRTIQVLVENATLIVRNPQRPSYHFDSSEAHSLNSWIRKHRR